MNLRKAIAAAVTTAALAAGTTVATGTAHADGCGTFGGYGWSSSLCIVDNGSASGYEYTSLEVNGQSASIDVRISMQVWTNCGGWWHTIYDNSPGIHAYPGNTYSARSSASCRGAVFYATAWETESGNRVSGTTQF
ncbi:hypothetical protein VR41_07950 [Streptomyces sp. NRRL B-1568]|nr:hypothetical protein VR41_07950 [Streptomyces sp. NRRL B-1568]